MIETGGSRSQFWGSTLREIALDLEVAEARHSREEQSRRWHTWHAAALPNVKKFPSFREFVPAAPAAAEPRSTRRIQSADQQEAALRQVFAASRKGRR